MTHRYVNRHRTTRVAAAAALVAATAIVAAGCAGSSTTKSSGSGSGTLTVSMPADIVSLDPQLQGDMQSMSVADNIFDTLTVRGANGQLVPGLATKWTQVNPLTWEFTIRKGVKFQNGDPLSASDVAFSINRMLDPATKSPIVELVNVKDAVAVNATTVDFQMKNPDPVIPAKVSLFGGVVLPEKLIQKEGATAFAQHPVGTGPYEFVSRQADNQIVLKANPHYWGHKAGVENLVFKIIPDAATALSALQSGQVDIVTGVTKDATNQLGDSSATKVMSQPGIRNYYLNLDTETAGPLANVDVRQALNYALDVPTLIKTVMAGAAVQSPTLIPNGVFGLDKSVSAYPYNISKAKQLLAEGGYPNGFTVNLDASNSDSTLAQAIAGQLTKAGITANVNLMDPVSAKSAVITLNQRHDGGMFLTANSGWTLDANSYLQSIILPTARSSRWNNAEANQLYTTQLNATDPSKRQDALSQFQTLLKDQAPFGYLFTINNVYAMSSNVTWSMPKIGVLSMASATMG